MTEEPALKRHEEPNSGRAGNRRELIKRLALLAATGYLAPTAVMISKPWACDRPKKPFPHGMCPSGPFC